MQLFETWCGGFEGMGARTLLCADQAKILRKRASLSDDRVGG